MKVIIAGSRSITNIDRIPVAVAKSTFDITELVCGMAHGVDTLAYVWAKRNRIPIKEFPADWKHFPRSAGYKRNEEMAIYADALIAVWDGNSKGTNHMIAIMKIHGKPVYIE